MRAVAAIVAFTFLAVIVNADLPIHCVRGDVLGSWKLELSAQKFDRNVKCNNFETASTLDVELSMPNIVRDKKGNKGTFTLIYDEGFEIRINGNKYFSYFQFKRPDYETSTMHESFCGLTLRSQGGSFHDDGVKKWGCFRGTKQSSDSTSVSYISHDGKKDWESCRNSDSDDCKSTFEETSASQQDDTQVEEENTSTKGDIVSPVPLTTEDTEEEDPRDLQNERDASIAADSSSDDEDATADSDVAEDDNLLDEDESQTREDGDVSSDLTNLLEEDMEETPTNDEDVYKKEEDLVDLINISQSSYKARLYPELFEGAKISDLQKMAGGVAFKDVVSNHQQMAAAEGINNLDTGDREFDENFDAGLPKSWDWRNVNGENYMFEAINQGMCGSCFAVATTDMIQTRARIITKNKFVQRLSPQDILNCGSRYAQGCKGGFPYLASKFTQDYGLTSDKCLKYSAETGSCPTNRACYEADKVYAKNYHYIGGYYGACNARDMMLEIMNNGPITVGFKASMSLMHYSSGVFLQLDDVEASSKNFFEPTNHAVLAVGWGVDDESGKKYWIVKNSWGAGWGQNGYFKIERGRDVAAFESMAVAATPVIPKSLLEKHGL